MKKRNVDIDIGKGIAIILVVVGHIIQHGSHNNFDYLEHDLFKVIYSFHMPLFIFLSGFVSAIGVKKQKLNGLILKKFKIWPIVKLNATS